jgi:hypothetical protein|tara:strand:+ start:150 stop:932 length:783 start_codon:yes stop_codon:yes gene_type:complete
MSNVELQLDLFEGQVLTTEQENTVREWIEEKEKFAMKRADYIKNLEIELLGAGFQKVQYVNDFTLVTKTNQERSFGYGDNRFTTEVSYVDYTGGIALKYNYFNSNEGKLASSTATVSMETEWSRGAYRTKLECSSITPQYRAYLPTSLLDKLNEKNTKANSQLKRYEREEKMFKYTKAKYEKLYPEATVLKTSSYSSYRSWEPIVKVLFKSGSYVEFYLGREKDGEFIKTKYNAITPKPKTTKQIMDGFNNQKAKVEKAA